MFKATTAKYVAQQAADDPPLAKMQADVRALQTRIDEERERQTPGALIDRMAREGLESAQKNYEQSFVARSADLQESRDRRAKEVLQAAAVDPNERLATMRELDADFGGMSDSEVASVFARLTFTENLPPHFYSRLAQELRTRGNTALASLVRAKISAHRPHRPELRDSEVRRLDRQLDRGRQVREGKFGLEIGRGGNARVQYFPIKDLLRVDGETAPTGPGAVDMAGVAHQLYEK